MSLTAEASAMANDGMAAEDISAALGTTTAVVRTVIDRTRSGGTPVRIRLPEDVYAVLADIAADSGFSIKTAAQRVLVEFSRKGK
tara:strand:+ start:2365 stop:2619 length:255 start_codon:yes stop_codon:yes gene_type:complete